MTTITITGSSINEDSRSNLSELINEINDQISSYPNLGLAETPISSLDLNNQMQVNSIVTNLKQIRSNISPDQDPDGEILAAVAEALNILEPLTQDSHISNTINNANVSGGRTKSKNSRKNKTKSKNSRKNKTKSKNSRKNKTKSKKNHRRK